MAYRTTAALVRGLLLRDYDGKADLTPRIATANLIVNRVVTCVTSLGESISSDEAEMMERWLAAYYYCKTDRTYSSNSTEGASASYTSDSSIPEPYKRGALDLDFSGCLAQILSTSKPRVSWGGKPDSDKRSYDDRNG